MSYVNIHADVVFRFWEEMTVDPLFWQALGKSLGWEYEHMRVNWGKEVEYSVPLWRFYAHRFYDLILTNQPTDMFWQELLS